MFETRKTQRQDRGFRTCQQAQFLKTRAANSGRRGVFGDARIPADKARSDRIHQPANRAGCAIAEADEFSIGQIRKESAGGISVGGQEYKVELIARDDRVNPDRPPTLAVELINKQGSIYDGARRTGRGAPGVEFANGELGTGQVK